MINQLHLWFAVLLLVVACSYASLSRAQATESPDLQLSAALDSGLSEVHAGDPISIRVSLTNRSSDVVNVVPRLDPEDGQLSVAITDPAGVLQEFQPVTLRDHTETVFYALASGQALHLTIPIFYGARGWVFIKPGRYVVSVLYRPSAERETRIKSNSFVIDVLPSRADTNALAGDTEESAEAGLFMLWRSGDHFSAGRDLLERIVAEDPDAAFADYFHLAAAESWSRPFKDFGAGRIRPADATRAIHHLERVRQARLQASARVVLHTAKARVMRALGRLEDAKASARTANDIIVADPVLQAYQAGVDRLMQAIAADVKRKR